MFLRPVRTSQPQGPGSSRIDWSNPRTRKLKFASTLGVSTSNEVNGMPNSWTSLNRVVTQKGYAAKFNGTSSFIQLPTSNLVAGDTVTLSFWANMTGATGVMACFVGSTYSALIGILSGKGLIFEFGSKSTQNQGVATASIPSGLVHVTYVSGPTESAVYFNGQRQTLTNLADAWGAPAVGNHSIGNRRNGSTAQFFNGTLSDFCVFEGALTKQEIKSLSDNPWQIFAPDSKSLWSPAAEASVTLPTLVQPNSTTSAGAWTATGAATLHGAINEVTPSDAEYISVNSASTTELMLAESAYPGTANQTLAYRASSVYGSSLTVTLKQGATTIMSRTHALTITDTLYTQTLTSEEIALITAGPISVVLTTS